MSKSPYTAKFRAMVSQQYLDGADSYSSLANKILNQQANLAKYKLHGLSAFQHQNGNASYSATFKMSSLIV